jgi:AcrR family transcriptional regulator
LVLRINAQDFTLERLKMARPKGDASVTEERKLNIIEAAFEVFSSRGFRGGSLAQVAELVEISEAGILHHFKSKGGLLIAVLEYRDQITQEAAHITSNMPGTDFVNGWFELIKFNISHPGIVELFCILSAEATAEDHPAHEFFKSRYEYVIRLSTDAMQDLADRGYLLQNLAPQDVARSLIALSDGLQVQWLLDRKWDMLDEHKNFFRATLSKSGIKAAGL